MNNATLCILIDENSKKILLGMKKRGFGEGKFNGFGGKPKEEEKIEDTAIRELYEEAGVKVTKEELGKVGKLNFTFSEKPEWNQVVHLFIAKIWDGEPKESEEMRPEWFDFKQIPFEKMWQDDKHWLPLVLEGKKLDADFTFGQDNETIKKYDIREVKE
jgi:8-oxo-dGTP pyrophosphatase MutT (NUDIX family)